MSERSPAELILAHQQRLAQCEPEQVNITAHEYLKSLYQDPNQPPSLRLRAAIKAIEVETPKISATANVLIGGLTFAQALEREERCIARSRGPVLLNGNVEEIDATEMKKPFSTYRRF